MIGRVVFLGAVAPPIQFRPGEARVAVREALDAINNELPVRFSPPR